MKNNKIKPENAPPEKQIVFCISLYFSIPKNFNRSNYLFKMYLQKIVENRFFMQTINNEPEKNLFKKYLSTQKTKRQISVEETKKTTSGVYLINKNLKQLVFEIMHDYKNGVLNIVEYKKPPTKREANRKTNEYLQEMGFTERIPLKKKSQKEVLKDWEKFKNELETQSNEI